MATRPQSPADAEIARLHTAWDASEVAYTTALDRAYSLTLPEADADAAARALQAANAARTSAYLDLLAAIDARRDGASHDPIIAQPSPNATLNAEVP